MSTEHMLTQHLLYTRHCSRCWNIAMKQTKFYKFFLLFSCSVVSQLFETPCMHCSMARLPCPSPTPGVHPNPCPLSRRCNLTLCHPLLLLPSIFSSIRVFSNELVLCIKWSNYWSFRFSTSPSNEYSGLIS